MPEPVSLELAKLQLRLDGTAENALIEQSITAAREWVEKYTGHLLVRREVVEVVGALRNTVNLSAWPDVVVTKVEYLAGGAMVSLDAADFRVAPMQRPAQLALVAPSGWFGAGARAAGAASSPVITVTMQAGYANGAVPAQLVRAMLVLIAAMYDGRGSLSDAAIASATGLCRPYRRWRV
ncbi:head-tail connector protein [Sphingomonas arantia]|uniref:Head-tail connector protein n=1 Tax=Sphingomonas arantia TaxID=1460676 RepID=A0ABW4U015_9SPHN